MKATRIPTIRLITLVGLFLLAFSLLGLAQQAASTSNADGENFDLDGLVGRVSGSKSLGFFTKISLKRDIDQLLANIRDYHASAGHSTLQELRERYDVLVHKLVVLLQSKDEELVKSIDDGREQLWAVLADKEKFAKL